MAIRDALLIHSSRPKRIRPRRLRGFPDGQQKTTTCATKKPTASRPKATRQHMAIRMVVAGGLILLIVWWYGGKLASDWRAYSDRRDAKQKAKEFWQAQMQSETEDERHQIVEGRIRAAKEREP